MLTADLVRATRRAGKLVVTPLAGKTRTRAVELADAYLAVTVGQVGCPQHEVKAAWCAVDALPREAKLTAGLIKLVEDACTFESESAVDPRVLRSDLFMRAAAARREQTEAAPFERLALLEAAGQVHGLSAEQAERALYADLKSEHRLLEAPTLDAEALVARYEVSQLQAVLLRAVQVTARVSCSTAAGYRELFRKLKFRRLLFQIEADPGGGYRIEIDGPFSLFESVTKYGLKLAMMLPALLQADRLELSAEVKWGKQRAPCTFFLDQKRARKTNGERARLPDEVEALLSAFDKPRSGWRAAPADKVLDLPGVGLCVPDLRFSHDDGAEVFLEVMGYWSREAVWKRVELVEKGISDKLLFAASQRLRVSEEVLAEHPSAALYVYKGTLSPKAVTERLERLREA
jgi:predicted nuclease of restriction endonuclease-like RecB superfamily